MYLSTIFILPLVRGRAAEGGRGSLNTPSRIGLGQHEFYFGDWQLIVGWLLFHVIDNQNRVRKFPHLELET